MEKGKIPFQKEKTQEPEAEGVVVHKVLFWTLSELLHNHTLQVYEHILKITHKASVGDCQ